MEPGATVQRNPHVAFRQLKDGTGVLLHLDSTYYHGVNGVGALIWSLLESPRTVDELVLELRSHLTHPPSDLPDDVREFVGDLEERDLVSLTGVM